MLHVDINKSHVNNILHIDIHVIYLACIGQTEVCHHTYALKKNMKLNVQLCKSYFDHDCDILELIFSSTVVFMNNQTAIV